MPQHGFCTSGNNCTLLEYVGSSIQGKPKDIKQAEFEARFIRFEGSGTDSDRLGSILNRNKTCIIITIIYW